MATQASATSTSGPALEHLPSPSSFSVPSVPIVAHHFRSLLESARTIKTESTILPILPAETFQNAFSPDRISRSDSADFDSAMTDEEKTLHDPQSTSSISQTQKDMLNTNISLAARRIFYNLTVSGISDGLIHPRTTPTTKLDC